MTSMTAINQNKWDTVVIKVKTASGTAFIHILESRPGVIYRVFFQIGKAGSDLNAVCDALATTVSELLKNRSITEVITYLSGYTSDKLAMHGSYEIRSIPEALMLALMQYRNGLPSDPGHNTPTRFRMR